MGISTDGILAFGVDLEEDWPPKLLEMYEDDEDGLLDFDLDEYILNLSEDFKRNLDMSWSKRCDIIKESPVEHVVHCSYEYPMNIFAVRGYAWNNHRGYVEIIKPEDMVVPEDRVARFRKWMADVGVDDNEPQWLLASVMG